MATTSIPTRLCTTPDRGARWRDETVFVVGTTWAGGAGRYVPCGILASLAPFRNRSSSQGRPLLCDRDGTKKAKGFAFPAPPSLERPKPGKEGARERGEMRRSRSKTLPSRQFEREIVIRRKPRIAALKSINPTRRALKARRVGLIDYQRIRISDFAFLSSIEPSERTALGRTSAMNRALQGAPDPQTPSRPRFSGPASPSASVAAAAHRRCQASSEGFARGANLRNWAARCHQGPDALSTGGPGNSRDGRPR